MSIALFALAAVMIVGGIVSVIQGFPFVRLESGLAMTIAGATTASADRVRDGGRIGRGDVGVSGGPPEILATRCAAAANCFSDGRDGDVGATREAGARWTGDGGA